MSISIFITNNEHDLNKIKKTVESLNNLRNIIKVIQPDNLNSKRLTSNDLFKMMLDIDDITILIAWYEDMLRMLYNGLSPDEFNHKPSD